jgi:hypothetical protein
MTDRKEAELKCPECGNAQMTTYYRSINVNLNPELKEELFKGQLNLFECEDCGNKALIDLVFLYHDMEKRFCVQYCPFSNVIHEDNWLAETYTIEGKPNYLDKFPETKTLEYVLDLHIVLSLEEMVRYVQFRDVLHAKLADDKSKH